MPTECERSPLSEVYMYTTDTMCKGISASEGGVVDLQQSLVGINKTLALPFLQDPNLVCSVSRTAGPSHGDSHRVTCGAAHNALGDHRLGLSALG